MNEEKSKLIILQKKIEKRNNLREKIYNIFDFDFEIPDYVVDDIIDNEEFSHICLMINMSVVNERISKEDSKILKERIKEIYNVKNMYDRVIK